MVQLEFLVGLDTKYVRPSECKPSIQELVTRLIQDNRAFQLESNQIIIGSTHICVELEESSTVYLVTIEEDCSVKVVKCHTIQEVYDAVDNYNKVGDTENIICGDIQLGDYIVGCERVGRIKRIRTMKGWVVKILEDGFDILCDDEYGGNRVNCVKLEYGSISKLPMKER